MMVKEIVKLEDGRDVVVNFTNEEHTYLLSYAVNHLIAAGMLSIGNDAGDVVGEAVHDSAKLDS